MYYNFHFVPLFSGIINLLLAIFVVFINPKRRLNQVFFALGVGLAWWNFGTYFVSSIRDPGSALLCVRVNLVGVIFLPALFYHLSMETRSPRCHHWTLRLAYAVAFIFLAFAFTPYFIESVRPYAHFYRPSAGPVFWIFCFGYFLVATYGTIAGLIKFLEVAPPSSIRPAKFLLAAVALLSVGGIHDMIPVLGLNYYPGTHIRIIAWGTLAASLYGMLIGYSILSDQLFDVRVSISRHSATALRLGFLGGIAFILMLSVGAVFPGTFSRQGLVASLVVLFLSAGITGKFFPKLFGRLSDRLEQGILGDHFDYQDKITAFIEAEPDSDDLQKLLDQSADLMFDQLSLSAIGIAIISGDAATRVKAIRSVSTTTPDWATLLTPDSALMQFFKTTGRAELDTRNDFPHGREERSAQTLLNSESLQLAFSIGSRARLPLGFLVIGPRRDGRSLTRVDVELLSALSRSIVFCVERIAIIQNEELRQANQAKDRFLTSINHEIRNPLNGITGIVRMLADTNVDPRSIFLLSTLQACADQLRSTMDDVLDFTQIESDNVTITTAPVNLVELVKTTCASHDLSGERLILAGLPSVDVIVRCDAGKVRQILSNYLANSLKYGVPTGAEIALFVNPAKDGIASVTITVTSTGPTLSQDELKVLFTALSRGRRARETSAHGTGLGLALCKKLAQAMSGSVGVTSAHGKTTFWFKSSFPTVSGLSAPEGIDLARFSGRRALAVEDEPYNRLVLGHYLAQFRISTVWAEDGQAALAATHGQTFDVILMDWLLPDMDGAELLQKLRHDREAPLPPVVVLSAYSTTSKRAECLAAGATAFISKPIDLTKLTDAFAMCEFGSLPEHPPLEDSPSSPIDLSSLFALGNESLVIDSFLREVQAGRTRLTESWRDEPHAAALLAHRLKAQMTLIRAKDCASLLEVLEQALNEKWSAPDSERLIDSITAEIDRIAALIRKNAPRAGESAFPSSN